jgi:20S proteasome subunit beta 3
MVQTDSVNLFAMSIDTYNGSAVIAMTGDQCVAIAADRRLGVQMLTLSTACQKVFQMNDRIFLGLSGLMTDVQTVHEKLRYHVNLLELKEERPIDVRRFASLVKSLLYKKRFGSYFIAPVIAGLQPGDNQPFVFTSDSIGAMGPPADFVTAGTCDEQLLGLAESLWRPGLGPEELFQCISRCLIAGMERDGLSGWGGIVHVMTPDRIITREIKTRMD